MLHVIGHAMLYPSQFSVYVDNCTGRTELAPVLHRIWQDTYVYLNSVINMNFWIT